MSGLSAGVSRFGGDDGSADPGVVAALSAFASGRGSEHDAVMSLMRSRLLVPIVAAAGGGTEASESAGGAKASESAGGAKAGEGADGAKASGGAGGAKASGGAGGAKACESAGNRRASEMSFPTLIGADGRPAIPAFTCMDTLRRWREQARPVPTDAATVWRAAAADGCAVVVDVAGPVPLAIDGARLAALAGGGRVPLPHQDPDVLAAARCAAAGQAAIAGLGLGDGDADCDMVIRLTLAAGCGPAQAEQAAGALAAEVMARLGGRLRRGIAIALAAETPPAGP